MGEFAKGYRRSIRRNGGCWLGQFEFVGPLNDQKQFFNEFLGYHFEEKSPLKTWAGMVYEMEFTLNGDTRRRSLETMNNAVKALTVDTNGNPVDTGWATDDRSIGRYGRKEDIIPMDGYDTAAAQARRDSRLTEAAWPWARAVNMGGGRTRVLTIRLVGYVFTGNHKYLTSADGNTGNVSDWVSSITTTDMEFVTAGKINTNTLQVKRSQSMKIRAADKIFELQRLGDASGNPWEFFVDAERALNYRQLPTDYEYKWINGELFRLDDSEVNPWAIWPGVIRDDSYPVSRAEPGTPYLADARDVVIEEVEVGESGFVLKTEVEGPENVLFAQQEYLYQMGLESGGGDGGQADRLNWKRKWAKEFAALGIDPWTDTRPRDVLIALAKEYKQRHNKRRRRNE